MSLRSSILAILLLGFLVLILINIHVVPFQFFLFSLEVPLFYIISLSVLFGVSLSWMFISLGHNERKWKRFLEKGREDKKK